MAHIERWNGNKWRARWRDPDGKTQSKVFPRKIDAENHITAKQHSKLTHTYIDEKAGRTTVAEYWAIWSERQQWRDSSRSSVTSMFDRQVLPALGKRQLASLRRGDIESWAAKMPRSRQYARQAAQYLATLLDAAVADRLIASNPARGAKRPRVDREPVVPFTAVEVDALRAAAPAWFDVALTLGLGAGLRQAEATGLTVDRVDFLRRQLVVDRQLLTRGAETFGPLKTSRSYRTVPLADSVIAELAHHVEVHGTGRDGLVVHLPDGGPVQRERFGWVWRQLRSAAVKAVEDDDDAIEAARLRARLGGARFHDTRHTYASTLLAGGVSVAAAAEYLGHSPAVLLSTYAHLMPGDHERARSVVEAAFQRASATSRVTVGSRA